MFGIVCSLFGFCISYKCYKNNKSSELVEYCGNNNDNNNICYKDDGRITIRSKPNNNSGILYRAYILKNNKKIYTMLSDGVVWISIEYYLLNKNEIEKVGLRQFINNQKV